MLKPHAAHFLLLGTMIGEMEDSLDWPVGQNALAAALMNQPSPKSIEFIKAVLPAVRAMADQLGLLAVLDQVDRIRNLLQYSANKERFSQSFSELKNRLEDDLKRQQFLHIKPELTRYYMNDDVFGEQVSAKFPDSAHDIAESGKCLALGRSTACVFHLMRIVEFGIQRLGMAVGATLNPRAGWLTILNNQLEPAINALPDTSETERERKRDLQQARAHLHAIRLAWRNDTMHPKNIYTEEEAKEVFQHVETFMRHLSNRL